MEVFEVFAVQFSAPCLPPGGLLRPPALRVETHSSYRLEVENLIKDLREGAMLIYVREEDSWYSVISPEEIERLMPLELLAEDETASLYRAKRGT